ncbi:MAG: DUF2807 domain-containing protein [Treponema sp.]|jgi:hypothetical protein|nr:DUF2807 domain-containing protein [Treponema sp.]
MKKMDFVGTMIVIGIIMICVSCVLFPVRGNRDIVTSERNVSSFEKVNSGGSAEVRFYASEKYRVVVTTDSNLLEVVTTDVAGNTLRIGTKNGNYSFSKLLIDVYCPNLTGISISGSGSFSSNDKITTSTFESNISGSGNINGNIECNNFSAGISGSGKINTNIICDSFSADISGSGNIAITGTGNSSNIRISGSGNFNGIEFKTNNVTARISGSGNMNIWALESIDANVSGSGSIKYRGMPKINFNGSGSGKIRSE